MPLVIIYFDFDSDELRPESVAQLKELAEALKSPSLRGSRFRLEGHTCDIGSPDYNQRLSERRAMSVKNRLVRNGVDPAQLLVKGYGMTRPIVPNTEGTRHLNRRVQVVTVEAQVASARRSGAQDPLRKDLERVAELIAQGDYDEAEAILKRLEAAVTEQTPAEDRARIAENRTLIKLHKGLLQ